MNRLLPLIIIFAVTALCICSCANVGAPDGGRYDETPPKMVSCRPALGSVGVNKKKMSIQFDEFIKLTGASEKVIVSPPQMEAANIRAEGKQVKITLYDSLRANTTYTIDFADAIEDNNEGNPMGFFTYSFSTGATIDSMEVAGTVISAEDHEPVKGMLVGLHPIDSLWHDSVFHTTPLLRVARTNASGRFCIKGVSEGKFRVFGLMDTDGDFCYSQRSEMIAFDTATVEPKCISEMVNDTLWHDSLHYDTIIAVRKVKYLPDDIVLRAFMVSKQEQHLLKIERPEPDWFRLYFTAPQDSLPKIEGLNFDASKLYVEASAKLDTLTYWLPDTTVTHSTDTLEMVLTYLDTDTTGVVAWKQDSVPPVVAKKGWAKIRDERQAKIEDWQKKYEKRRKRSKKPLPPETNPYLTEFLDVRVSPNGSMDANRNINIRSAEPILKIDTTRIHLYHKKDSTLTPEPFLIYPSETDPRAYTVYAEWKPNMRYSLLVDSTAITSIMGKHCKKISAELNVRGLDEYGSLFVNILPKDTVAIVELLSSTGKAAAQAHVGADGTAEFFFLKPDTYYLRCFLDTNGNGIWDAGDYDEGRQSEEVYYFPKPMLVRALWDTEQDWDIRSIPILSQKPDEIRKQKGEKEKTPRNLNAQRDAEKAQRNKGK